MQKPCVTTFTTSAISAEGMAIPLAGLGLEVLQNACPGRKRAPGIESKESGTGGVAAYCWKVVLIVS
jgi:hypothetical protein